MLFNSVEFVFVFLPLVLIVFYLLGSRARSAALMWLTLASLFFYAWWRPINVLLIAPSILINYGLARWMVRIRERESGKATTLLVLGILFNVAFLGYFKYRNFFLDNVNALVGTDFHVAALVLPLGISFITFQKIAFLVDVHGGRAGNFSLREYFLFVLFFPQLIAGPIVHYTEVMPQFRQVQCRFESREAALGLTLFVFGLFKKLVLADGIAPHVSQLFAQVEVGSSLPMTASWLVAVGYTMQLYFDFSGYSDMALGLARLFGIRLPMNFDAPMRATNIIDFWRRWHITLTRFLTAYIYNPLVLTLTRRRMAAGKPVSGGKGFAAGPFIELVAVPTLLVMLVSGIWHGAGNKFVIWGLMHGTYLCVNHLWRAIPAVRRMRSDPSYHRLMSPVGLAMTFLAVAFAMVFFGAPSTATALDVVRGMVGLNGLGMPPAVASMDLARIAVLSGYAVGLTFLAVVGPTTLQVLQWDEDVQQGVGSQQRELFAWFGSVRWQPTLRWAGLVAALAAVAVFRIGGPSEFLYWQF